MCFAECPAYEVFECRDEKCGEQKCFDSCIAAEDTPCVNNCFCADGYRRINGICIPENKCPKQPITCDFDEVFDCRYRKCYGRRCLFEKPAPCDYKCYCTPGYEKIDGKCVHDKNCPLPNTEYKSCYSACTESICPGVRYNEGACADCFPGCGCKEGFVLSFDRTCIEPDQCPPWIHHGYGLL